MADKAMIATDKELARIEKELTEIYERAGKELAEKADKYFEQFKAQDEQKRALVDAGKLTEDDYKAWREEKMVRGKHWTNMKESVAQELARVNQTAMEYVNGEMSKVYAMNYNFSAKEIEVLSGNAISFELINREAVEHLVKAGDKSLLPAKHLDPAKDIPWNMKTINSEVLQGIIQGESIDEIKDRIFPEIMSKTNVAGKSEAELKGIIKKNYESSVRAARTVVNGTLNTARHNAAERAAAKGVVMAKCWTATRDDRTRDWHTQAWSDYGDKENAIPIDEPFIVNGEKMMYPGDPSASPENLYNCRCIRKNVVLGFDSTLPPELQGKIKVTFTDE